MQNITSNWSFLDGNVQDIKYFQYTDQAEVLFKIDQKAYFFRFALIPNSEQESLRKKNYKELQKRNPNAPDYKVPVRIFPTQVDFSFRK